MRIEPVIVTEPSEEPVTLAEAKLHCRVDHDEDDTHISALITAARQTAERELGRTLVTTTYRVYFHEFPHGHNEIELPYAAPLQSVTSLTYTDDGGTTTTWTGSGSDLMSGSPLSVVEAHVDIYTHPGRIVLPGDSLSWPTDNLKSASPIAITYVAGYGAATAVPVWAKQLMLLRIGHWYEHREEIVLGKSVAIDAKPLPGAYSAILALYNIDRF
jgi:uncharacterized phiE125 gp8 family phage protein